MTVSPTQPPPSSSRLTMVFVARADRLLTNLYACVCVCWYVPPDGVRKPDDLLEAWLVLSYTDRSRSSQRWCNSAYVRACAIAEWVAVLMRSLRCNIPCSQIGVFRTYLSAWLQHLFKRVLVFLAVCPFVTYTRFLYVWVSLPTAPGYAQVCAWIQVWTDWRANSSRYLEWNKRRQREMTE